jgi:hypothetical protein
MNSSFSNEVSAFTPDVTAPEIPTGFSAEALSDTKIILNWDPNPDKDIAGYLIYMNDTNSNRTGEYHLIHKALSNEHSFTIDGLVEQTICYFKIKAFDEVPNYSPFSPIASVKTPDLTYPGAPSGLKVLNTSYDKLTLTWEANTELDVIGYNVYRLIISKNSFIKINSEPVNSTVYIDTGLDEKTRYSYKITAVDDYGLESSFSEVVYGETRQGPHPPEILYPPDDFEIREDTYDIETINLYHWFYDINGGRLSFRWSGEGHINVSIKEDDGKVLLGPKKNWNGVETITFYVSDGIFPEIKDSVTITVTPVNDPPEQLKISSPNNLSEVQFGESITLIGSAYDPDVIYGDKLTFKWSSDITGELGHGDTLEDVRLPIGEHTITLEVSDEENVTSTTSISINVKVKEETEDPGFTETKDKEEEKDDFDYLPIMLIIIIIVIILVISFILLRKRREAPPTAGETKDERREAKGTESEVEEPAGEAGGERQEAKEPESEVEEPAGEVGGERQEEKEPGAPEPVEPAQSIQTSGEELQGRGEAPHTAGEAIDESHEVKEPVESKEIEEKSKNGEEP